MGAGATKMLETALAKSGMFDVYTRAEMDKVLKEQALGQTGMMTAQSAAKTGQMIGVNVIVVGAVTEFGEKVEGVNVFFLAGGKKSAARVVIDVQLIDTTTGKIVKALSAEGEEANAGVSLFVVSGGTSSTIPRSARPCARPSTGWWMKYRPRWPTSPGAARC